MKDSIQLQTPNPSIEPQIISVFSFTISNVHILGFSIKRDVLLHNNMMAIKKVPYTAKVQIVSHQSNFIRRHRATLTTSITLDICIGYTICPDVSASILYSMSINKSLRKCSLLNNRCQALTFSK